MSTEQAEWEPVSSLAVATGDDVRVPSGCSFGFAFTADFIEGRVVDVTDRCGIVLDQQGDRVTVDGTCDTRWWKRIAPQRAEGFWWVRWRPTEEYDQGEWDVAKVEGEYVIFGDVYEDVRDPTLEWGPYLGKEPGPMVGGRGSETEYWRSKYKREKLLRDDALTRAGNLDAHVGKLVRELNLLRARAMRAEQQLMLELFDPSADYEGEDTRAIDGAMQEQESAMIDHMYELQRTGALVAHGIPPELLKADKPAGFGFTIERAYQRTVEADDEARRAAYVRAGCHGGFDEGWAAGVEWGRRP